jgi:hypothetical protein
MSRKVSELMRGRLQNNAVRLAPGTRDGLMISGGGFQGKTETACRAAAEFEDLWRDICRQFLPAPAAGTRDVFVPVAYCRLPVRATPKGLCKAILDIYGDPHPPTLHDLVRADALSEDTRAKGMNELRDLGLVTVRRVPVNPDDFDLERIRNTYTLNLGTLAPARTAPESDPETPAAPAGRH